MGQSAHFFLQLNDAKIKQFEDGIVVRKCATFGYLAKAGIDRLNGVGCIHNLANRRRVIEKLLDVGETAFPDTNRAGILTQDLAETLEFDSASFKARCAIDFFQMDGD